MGKEAALFSKVANMTAAQRKPIVDALKHTLLVEMIASNELEGAADCLFAIGQEDTHTLWSLALLSFKMDGDCDLSREALHLAMQRNQYVADLIRNRRRPSTKKGCNFQPRTVEEAENYVAMALDSWIDAVGAIQWIGYCLKDFVQHRPIGEVFPGIDVLMANTSHN